MENKAEIKNVKKNILGTISFDMKCKGHRGFQDFIVYPIDKDSDAKIIYIQSNKRWAELNLEKKQFEINKSNASKGNRIGFMMDKTSNKTIIVHLTEYDAQLLKKSIFKTASSEAGKEENGIMQLDNSGAINLI